MSLTISQETISFNKFAVEKSTVINTKMHIGGIKKTRKIESLTFIIIVGDLQVVLTKPRKAVLCSQRDRATATIKPRDYDC